MKIIEPDLLDTVHVHVYGNFKFSWEQSVGVTDRLHPHSPAAGMAGNNTNYIGR